MIPQSAENKPKNDEIFDNLDEYLDIDFFLNFPKLDEEKIDDKFIKTSNNSTKNIKKMVKFSEVLFFHYTQSFIEWIMNLPQLRHDMLKLYKINLQDFEEIEEKSDQNLKVEDLEKGYVKYSDYLELLKYALNFHLNNNQKDMNIMKIISKINFKLFISGARFF